MKQLFVLCFFLIACISASAQDVIASQGDSYSSSDAILDFTIGETVTTTETDGSSIITQGFQQISWRTVGVKEYITSYDIAVYPNPANDVLHLQTEVWTQLSYRIYDSFGKLILEGDLSGPITQIPVQELAKGGYSILIQKDLQQVQSIKFIKIQ